MLRLLLDENVDSAYARELVRRDPTLVIGHVGAPGTPAKGTPDPDLLFWCESHEFLLVTNNRKSMPRHLADHLALGRHSPGIILLNSSLSVGATVDDLWLIATGGDASRFSDRISYLPI